MAIKPQILKAIKNNNLVLFIGSGLSRSLGFPDWKGLVEEILRELAKEDPKYNDMIEILNNNFFNEIEILEKIKGKKSEIYGVLDRIFDVPNNEFTNLSLHKKLGSLSTKIITTNYDKALETATGFKKVQFDNNYHIANLSKLDNYVFKLHGCIESPDKCILFEEDYEELYSDKKGAIERLRNIIADQTIIFIGFSLSDPYVKRQFEYISKVYKGLSNKHYIISTDNTTIEESGIEPIIITDWEQGFDNFLDSLIEQKKSYSEVGVTAEKPIENTVLISGVTTEPFKVALLIASPIDMDCDYNFDKITNEFKKFNMQLDVYYLSEENLRDLEEYDYIFIFSKLIQNKLVVEDQYLKSKFMSLEEIEQNLVPTEKLKGIIVIIDKAPKINRETISFPVVRVWNVDLSNLLFKIFRKGMIDNTGGVLINNEENIRVIKVERGNAEIRIKGGQDKSKLSQFIDSKNLTSFIGRTTDQEDIIRKILETKDRILTLKGSGGIGKTATIKKVALEFFKRGYFDDGIHFIDCEFIDNFKTFEYKITQCFGLDGSINLREHIIQNSMTLDALIILDNFEPILYINESEKIQIQDIINFICEYSTIVITSREWIGFEFEQRHELRAFTSEEALRLFQKYYRSFIKESDMKILKEDILENLLNNNPLAVKIVSRNIPKGKDFSDLEDELAKDFFNITETEYTEIFDGNSDKNIERSKSLYQSIFYSYKKLKPKEKILFEILSLFPDGIHMQNIKTFFDRDEFRTDIHRITDKEVKGLENKSLIEINKGIITLQSIIGRFAEFQLANRTEEEKSRYYKRAYQFNGFLLHILNTDNFDDNTDRLRIFDQNEENILKCISYITKFEEDKINKIEFIRRAFYFFIAIEQTSNFYVELIKIKSYFNNIENGELLIEVLIINSRYYEGNFEKNYKHLNELLPLENLVNIDVNTQIGRIIVLDSLSVYRYSKGYEVLNYLIDNNFHKTKSLSFMLFQLGKYNSMVDLDEKDDFFTFEVAFNLEILDKSELEEYICNLYKKQYTEIMQTHYIKAKLGIIEKKEINKLVVTNPYTLGLKNLMEAFLEENEEKATELYKTAIMNLEHISYYYVESIYFYAKYLGTIKSLEMNEWFNKGLLLAKQHKFNFLIYLFNKLISDDMQKYSEENSEFPLKSQLESYLIEYKQYNKSEH